MASWASAWSSSRSCRSGRIEGLGRRPVSGGRAPRAGRRSGSPRSADRAAGGPRTGACRGRRRPGRRAPARASSSLSQKREVDITFAGLVGHQVPEVADLGLADAVNATEALLDAVRVPRQVVVDHQVRALQVDALPGGIGGEENLDLGIVRNDSCAFRRSSRPMPPWMRTTASRAPSRVVIAGPDS